MLSFLSFSNRYYIIFLTHNWDHLAVSGGFSIGVTTNNRVADRFTICSCSPAITLPQKARPAFGRISEPHTTEYGHIQSVTTALYMSAYDLSVNLFF